VTVRRGSGCGGGAKPQAALLVDRFAFPYAAGVMSRPDENNHDSGKTQAADEAHVGDDGGGEAEAGMRPHPYRIAVLCYLYDQAGRLLLLHRARPPNFELFSPIGGKLEFELGESPTACALREIEEEAGLQLHPHDLSLVGIVSERSYEDSGHWMLFCFEVTRPVEVEAGEHDEGRLEWHPVEAVDQLNIPETDRRIIWPAFLEHRGGGFFMVHIECADGRLEWRFDESRPPSPPPSPPPPPPPALSPGS